MICKDDFCVLGRMDRLYKCRWACALTSSCVSSVQVLPKKHVKKEEEEEEEDKDHSCLHTTCLIALIVGSSL